MSSMQWTVNGYLGHEQRLLHPKAFTTWISLHPCMGLIHAGRMHLSYFPDLPPEGGPASSS